MGGCLKSNQMILDSTDNRWNDYLTQFPDSVQDIYYTSQYYQVEQTHQEGIGQLFVYEGNNNIAVYPFIKRPILNKSLKGKYYDIETAYGYGGPIVKSRDKIFEQVFEQAFLKYCQKEGIVDEFVRFHPLLNNEDIFRQKIQVSHNRNTVWLNLELPLEDIWMHEISTQNRNTIRKCEKSGLYVEEGDNYGEFIEIYNDTMKRIGADKFYHFHNSYYNYLKTAKGTILLYVKKNDEILAAAIFLGYGNYFHYHLSGSKKEYLKLAPNNILLWEAIKYAKKNGYKRMHFGGGLTDSEEDNLFRFKQKFSSCKADFYIGRRIHNKEIYFRLIEEWEEKNKQKAKLLLQYRM